MNNIINRVSIWSVPLIVIIILIFGYIRGVKLYEEFTSGAAESLEIILKIFPALLAMLTAINIFQAAGTMDLIISHFGVFFEKLNIPIQVIPLLFLRPLSGSASLSYISKLFENFGVDSIIGLTASTIQGSTETTFYIIAVYFGAVGIKKFSYSIFVGLAGDLAGFFAALFICNFLFK